ncbi:MAG TPA: hypothetical protein VFA98_10210 [Thermoanaerobaculia bacterium]|nr:hypothetical protein [Thermoanaerobaculia bacterium]
MDSEGADRGGLDEVGDCRIEDEPKLEMPRLLAQGPDMRAMPAFSIDLND